MIDPESVWWGMSQYFKQKTIVLITTNSVFTQTSDNINDISDYSEEIDQLFRLIFFIVLTYE